MELPCSAVFTSGRCIVVSPVLALRGRKSVPTPCEGVGMLLRFVSSVLNAQ
jgi:hypothetical protein